MEEMGMTDMQFKSFLKEYVADLERIKKLTEDEETIGEVAEELEKLITRYQSDIES